MKHRNFEVSSEVSGLDTERILGVLARHGVDYVLIGGLAAAPAGTTYRHIPGGAPRCNP